MTCLTIARIWRNCCSRSWAAPDRRQIDGLGGADKLTSKAAIMGPPTRADSDVSYLFGQVGITVPQVEFNVNCGNLTAAAAVYAIEEGLVAPREGTTRVRIHNVNTDKIITADVPVANGKAAGRRRPGDRWCARNRRADRAQFRRCRRRYNRAAAAPGRAAVPAFRA